MDSVRAQHPDALIFSAGDSRTGNPLNDMHATPNLPIVSLMNKVRFDLSALGTHEFDGKVEGLRFAINEAYFLFVCVNIYPNDTLRIHVYPYKMFNIDGVKIGVLGLIQTKDAILKYLSKTKQRFRKKTMEIHDEWDNEIAEDSPLRTDSKIYFK